MASSLQIKFNEVESMLNLKTKEVQTLTQDVDRQRFEMDRLTVNNRALISEKEEIKKQIKEYEMRVEKVHI